MTAMKKMIAGNWKMNGSVASMQALVKGILEGIKAEAGLNEACDFVVCPPYVHLPMVNWGLKDSAVALGGQDCALAVDGAYTGDISAAMLADVGCKYVILGHSERRQHHGETDAEVAVKAKLAWDAGLSVIICVGETDRQRAQGQQESVVGGQLAAAVPSGATFANTVIAYEPVWAIGTGKNATPDDVQSMHRFIRGRLQEQLADSANMRILYGGSVKPDNAATLFTVENVDGALIGGASLKADQYLAIAGAVKI
jgi:triosephosphate isomerase